MNRRTLWVISCASLAYAFSSLTESALHDIDPASFFAVAVWNIPLLLFTFVYSLVPAIAGLLRKQWSALALPLIPMAAFLAAGWLTPYVSYPHEYARFLRTKPSFDAEIANMPHDGKRFKEFDFGGMTYAGKAVVYDESDQISLKPGKQSAKWMQRAKNTDLTCGQDAIFGGVMHLEGHYYLATTGC